MCYDGISGECSNNRRRILQSSPSSRVISGWQEAQLKEAFDLMARGGDGTIKAPDLMHFVRFFLKSEVGDKEVERMIDVADRGGKGAVNFQEFLSLVQTRIAPREPSLGDKALEEIFRVLDRDGDGVLSAGDLSGFMESLGPALSEEEILAMVRTATGSDRRNVTYRDFCHLMSSNGGVKLEVF